MNFSNEEKMTLIKALQFYINNENINNLTYENLRKFSDLKERIRLEIK